MRYGIRAAFLTFVAWCYVSPAALGQRAATAPDELIMVDGERLLGHLERSEKDTVLFKSDLAGEIKLPWSKIKELHSGGKFAVIPKDFHFGRRHEDTSRIPQGELSVADQKITVTDGTRANQTFPTAATSYVVDTDTFQKALRRPGIFQDWKGAATAGVSLVVATQDDRTYTSGISLVRSIPTEPWMNPENRTTIDFTSSYGELTQPGFPTVKTSIFHGDAERDEYFKPELYVFAQTAFDHNYSLGLDLQETFGGGVGWTILKSADEQFDLRAELTYVKQEFQLATQNQNLVGSIFSEDYRYKFKHGILLQEVLAINPAWNNTRAYSANGTVILTVPIAKRLSLNVTSVDTFLNDPSPGFRKNSFQFSTGATYTLP